MNVRKIHLGIVCAGLSLVGVGSLGCQRAGDGPKERANLQGHTDYVQTVAFSPDGKTLASGSMDATIKLWDTTASKELITLLGHTEGASCVAFSPDGKTLASGGEDRTIKLWDEKRGKKKATLKGHTKEVSSV